MLQKNVLLFFILTIPLLWLYDGSAQWIHTKIICFNPLSLLYLYQLLCICNKVCKNWPRLYVSIWFFIKIHIPKTWGSEAVVGVVFAPWCLNAPLSHKDAVLWLVHDRWGQILHWDPGAWSCAYVYVRMIMAAEIWSPCGILDPSHLQTIWILELIWRQKQER